MATTIFEALSCEQPCGIKSKNESLKVIYMLVKLHMNEIEEARECGYSWTQIENVCKKLWKSNTKGSKIIWRKNGDLVRSCYKAVKDGRIPQYVSAPINNGTKSPSKKYSIEVTEA